MVREDSHTQHEKFWGEVSGMSEADKAANGDFYLFKPEVLCTVHTAHQLHRLCLLHAAAAAWRRA